MCRAELQLDPADDPQEWISAKHKRSAASPPLLVAWLWFVRDRER
jgi:hypothetical protein